MKNYFLTLLAFLFFSTSSIAQDFEPPKKGAKIYTSSNSIELSENGTVDFDLYLVKSKVARKAAFEDPRFLSPNGLEFTLRKDGGDPNHYSVTAKAESIPSGEYSVTVTGKRNGMHLVTGTILSVSVKPEDAGRLLSIMCNHKDSFDYCLTKSF